MVSGPVIGFMPGLALNVAATSLVGQALGKWQPEEEATAQRNMAIWIGLVVMIVLAIPIIILAPYIIRLFDPSAHPVVLATGVTYFHINTVVLPLAMRSRWSPMVKHTQGR
ncbi:MAG: MATE family efflux transporter [Caldilineaceae bacterium]